MDKRDFNLNITLYELTEEYPESIDILVELGFENMKDEKQRKSLGKTITVDKALKLKNIDREYFLDELEVNIGSYKGNENSLDKVSIAGVLPCPVKHPLMDSFEKWMNENEKNLDFEIEHELKAASTGVEWLLEVLREGEFKDIPDLFISAGFDLFFDKELFGKYKEEKLFQDITGIESYNSDLENDKISLRDPKRNYSMIGVVPAVFMVNTEELDGRKMPRTWKDLLTEDFYGKVSLPISDFDLFNSILLNIYANMGEEGVRKLGKVMKSNMHPSEMVKSHKKKSGKPIVTIMPYFFTKMVKENDPLKPVWPEDGAIISPIFMLSKTEKSEKLKPVVDFFSSKEVGEILAHNGRFPSVHPKVDNRLANDVKFMWIGWDFINNNDIGALIDKCEDIFDRSVKGEI